MTQFDEWSAVLTSDFWQNVANKKLDIGLSDEPLDIQGYFIPIIRPPISAPLYLDFHSLSKELDKNRCPSPGKLYITNTIEAFLSDKEIHLQAEAGTLWEDITSGRAEEDCRLLNRFVLVCHCDLKAWKFSYALYIPALPLPEPLKFGPVRTAFSYFDAAQHSKVLSACKQFKDASETSPLPFFLLHLRDEDVRARPLSEWADCQDGKVVLCFCDPSANANKPGWPLRNLLQLAAQRWGLTHTTVLCWRLVKGRPDLKSCLVMDVELPQVQEKRPDVETCGPTGEADLSSTMDATRLSISAADLNLKLMRWRHFKQLDLDKISKTKCLLLGAGTLGCQVARDLLAWGFRDITFVDNGKVGHSNPLRQSLYQLEDVGKLKAEAAATSLQRFCVDVRSRGEVLGIPMAGHAVIEHQMQDIHDSYLRLKELYEEHDVIFILTDTRESRWLPTLLGAASDTPKILVNAAVGFDSYVVMRHGDGPGRTSDGPRLGCYFCNDVVAPANSMINRTLDQQCTVSIPGLASITASLSVHMAVGVLHHPDGVAAPADGALELNSSPNQPLGLLPHQVRGFLSHCTQLAVTGLAFDRCTACCPKVVSELKERDFEFVLDAMNCPNYLEDLSGLTALLSETNSLSLDGWEEEVSDQ